MIVTAGYADVYKVSPTKNVIVIEAKDIQGKGYQNIEEVLDDIPSINVGKTGFGDIDIRGQGEDSASNNLQVMLDGAPITNLVNHPMQTNYNVVPVDNIEKIEIIPGGGSILYGGGSAGGIINITTNLKNIHNIKKNIKVSIGTNNRDISGHFGYRFNDKLSTQFSYTRLEKDLYFKDTYRHSDYITAGLNYKFNDNHNVSLRYGGLFEKGQFIKQLKYETLKNIGKNYVPENKKITVGLDNNNHKIEKMVSGYMNADRDIHSVNATYTGYFKNVKYNVDTFYSKGFFTNTYDDLVMDHKTLGMKHKLDISYGKNSHFADSSILFGVDLFKQSAKLAYNDYRTLSWKDKTYVIRPLSFEYDKTTLGLYVLNNLHYKQIDFSQGIRLDRTFWGFDKVAAKNEGSAVSQRNNLNTSLGLAYNYRDTGKVYMRYERSFTSPDGLQITDDFSKQDIMPTKGEDTIYDMFELGWRDEFDFITADITAFYTSTDNEMTRNYVMDPILGFGRKSINILKTTRKGIEVSLSEQFGNLTLEQSYAYLKGKREYNNRAKDFIKANSWIDWTNAGLKKVPKHKLVLKAKYDFNEQWSASAKYNYSGKYTNFTDDKELGGSRGLKPEEAFISSYSTVDVNLSYKNLKGLSVSAGINNLFNKKYFEYVGEKIYSVMPAEERSYYLDVKYSF
ncbi:Colicin I receptor precursor [Phocoenobacter uteri]|uniref:Colicin I receptor n=1 Tax=Phocoenobacter uteri TaxID=146806 RepID=A0A379CBH9_9PAST|nr:TonB-dependent receptor [Phocoenobacter uteri]MDG6881469.1 ligand-gated channel [Phocoenobacter uteri]SUB59499.1 Colicin I receptor precursor [Phocoenobacter uteri]